MIEPLNIPLTENPTRQKVWRVVVFVAPLLLAAAASVTLFRGILLLDTLSGFAPDNTKMTLRLVKTPETARVLEDNFHGVLLFENAPWSINDLSSWSNRELALYFSDQDLLGFAVSGSLPPEVQNTARELGYTVLERWRGTYVGVTPQKEEKVPIKPVFLPIFSPTNGDLLLVDAHRHAPMRLKADSLTLSGIGRSPSEQEMPKITNNAVYALFNVTSAEAEKFLGFDVPLVFPGLRALMANMVANGFTLMIGDDGQGITYAISTSGSAISPENLENTVQELYSTNKLTTITIEDVHTSLDEIITTTLEKPISSDVSGSFVTSIKSNDGTIVRAAQTLHGTIVTNRPINISESISAPQVTSACLKRANQWIAFSQLKELFPASLTTPGMTITKKFIGSQEIAFAQSKTRVCW